MTLATLVFAIGFFSFTVPAQAEPEAFKLIEGHYRSISSRPFIRKVQVGVVGGEYQVIGQLCYGVRETACAPFNLYVNLPHANPTWKNANGAMRATFYNPSYGTIHCQVDISAEVHGYVKGQSQRMLLVLESPSTYPTKLSGPYCPTPGPQERDVMDFELVR